MHTYRSLPETFCGDEEEGSTDIQTKYFIIHINLLIKNLNFQLVIENNDECW
jgi:hypothetical protein